MSKFTSDIKSGFTSGYTSGHSFTAPKRTQILTGIFAFLIGLIGGILLYQGIAPKPSIAISVENAENSAKNAENTEENAPKIRKLSQKSLPSLANINFVANNSASSAPETPKIPQTGLYIPQIGLYTPVSQSVNTAGRLSVPNSGASVYGTLIMGHVYGVFSNLSSLAPGTTFYYNGATYQITSVEKSLPVSADQRYIGSYSVGQLSFRTKNELVLMTCAGSYNQNLGTHDSRTIVFAQKV